MFYGNELWNSIIPLNMEQRQYGNLTYDTYVNLPDSLYNALLDTAQRTPDKTFLVDDDGTEVSFAEFQRMVDVFAEYLRLEAGVSKGKHVALMLFSSREFCVAYLALIKLGAVTLPLPSKFRQQEVLSLLDKSDSDVIICDKQFESWMASMKERGVRVLVSDGALNQYGYAHLLKDFRIPGEPVACQARPEDPAILMFTSGTTSLSKGVVLTNFNVMHAVVTYQKTLDITSKDSTIIAVPIYHVTGLIALLSLFLHVGGTVYLHRFFDAERVLQCIRDNKVTFTHASPTFFSLLMQHKDQFPELPSLRAVACGSSYMPKGKILEMHRWLPNTSFHIAYGLTETSSPATVFPCDAAQSEHIGSSGLPVPGTVFRIVDDNGSELLPGQVGEVQIKGSVILREYYKMQTPALTEDGWLSTGDLGYFAPDGYLFLVDRKKDMINRGGEKICSYDVENELYMMPGVEEAAVVGIPDPLYGEVSAAVIKCRPGVVLTQEEIQDKLRGRLARYKIPVKILFVDDMPITPNGKINKREIRKMFE